MIGHGRQSLQHQPCVAWHAASGRLAPQERQEGAQVPPCSTAQQCSLPEQGFVEWRWSGALPSVRQELLELNNTTNCARSMSSIQSQKNVLPTKSLDASIDSELMGTMLHVAPGLATSRAISSSFKILYAFLILACTARSLPVHDESDAVIFNKETIVAQDF